MSIKYSNEGLDRIIKTLRDDREFTRAYRSVKIRDTQGSTSGKSADVSRREVIASYCNKHNMMYPRMRQRIELQQYFDNLLGLDPYGLEEPKSYVVGTSVTAEQLLENINFNKENQMTDNSKIIETKTFIYGVDATNMTDEDIFGEIYKLEQKMKKFDEIKNKPNKLVGKIAEIQKGIDDLVKFVDERQVA